MMADAPHFCFEQVLLMGKVQQHLIRLAELSRATADAKSDRNDNLARELDHEVENELGAEERALGALRHHREEHGC
jgi:hypothetical protein